MTGPRPSLEDIVRQTDARPPLDAIVAASGDPNAQRHADYRSGALGARMAEANAADVAEAQKTPVVQRVAEAVVSGLPGAQRAVSGYRGLLSLMGVGDETPEEATTEQQRDVASLPMKARLPLQIVGSAPLAALAAGGAALKGGSAIPTVTKGLSMIPKVGETLASAVAPAATRGIGTAGAIFGAAQGADKPAANLGERTQHTIEDAALTGLFSKGAGAIGSGLANLSQRTGFTDALAGAVAKIPKVGPTVAAAMGTRGQVNAALADRQDILDQLGDAGVTAGKVQLDRIAATKAKASELYGLARRDQQAITDPRLQQLLSDPDVQRVYQTVQEMRAAQGVPLPRMDTPGAPPPALVEQLRRSGADPDAINAMLARTQAGANAGRPGMLDLASLPSNVAAKGGGIEVPDPDALATMKRYLSDASRGLNSPLNLKQDEARDVLGKATQIRQILHEVSGPWKAADAFYADAKGQEDAFAHGFDAFRLANNPSGEQLPTHTPEAMLQAIETPRSPGEPTSAMRNRADAFRAGVKAAVVSQVKGAPVTAGASTVLRSPTLAGDEATQQVRSLMFPRPSGGTIGGEPVSGNDLSMMEGVLRGSPPVRVMNRAEPQTAGAFEQALAGMRGKAATLPHAAGNYFEPPVSRYHVIRRAARALQAPDALTGPVAQQMIAARQANPAFLARELPAFRQGQSFQDVLGRLAAVGVGNRPVAP